MQLFAVGLNHETAPVSVREKLAFGPDVLPSALLDLLSNPGLREAAIVSTCNRTELYCNTQDVDAAITWLAQHRGVRREELEPFLYRLPGKEAARHAFRVASGLDSMVLGEAQILGQLKDAVRDAESAGSLGILLNTLFQKAFSVAKEVRTETQIGAHSVSMAAAAVKLAERIFPTVAETRVLFIGAGEMIELCATYFAAQRPRSMTVANRTLERGQALASQFGAQAITLPELADRLHEFDVVVTSTASPLPILGKGMVERALKARRRKPMFMVDLAVPRDIEPEVGQLGDVYLYTVDDLAQVVKQGREERQHAVSAAEAIIARSTDDFMRWVDNRAIVPTIRELKDHAERIRRNELDRARKQLARGDDPLAVLDALSTAITNKFLHAPLSTLNQAEAQQHDELIALVRRLYHLHDPE